MLVKPVHTTIFKTGDSLEDFIFRFVPKLKEKSILVVTSKIVALSQGRVIAGKISEKEKEKWIKKESESYIKTKWCYLTFMNGHWCANAGIDESNAETSGLILWPKDPFGVAEYLRKKLQKRYSVNKLGVVITDSRIFPLRAGVSGVAIGYTGFKGLRNYIGKKDLFGRRLKMTKTNIADSLATAAVLVMGEGNEQTPLAAIEDVDIVFTSSKTKDNELRINPKDDLYGPIFGLIRKIKQRRRK